MLFKRQEGHQIIEERLPGSENTVKKYSKGRLLGKGGFAKCYQLTSLESSRKYAAKVIEKSSLNKSKAKEKLSSEIKIHKSLKHQNIVGFEHCFEDSDNVYILLELCPNQTLNELLKRRKRLTEIEVQYYLYQITNAVSYLHSQKVIHRDLKLGNLFLSDKLEIKIGDFGLATKLSYDGQLRKTMCGTPNYIAPQILINKKGHSYQVDAWSIGVIAYALLVGKPPFETHDVKLTYSKIKSASYVFPQTLQISEKARNFVSKLLQLDPCKRLTLEEALHDTFFTINEIPASLPISTLACPPNSNFMRQFQKEERCLTTGNDYQNHHKRQVGQSQEAFQVLKASRSSIQNLASTYKMDQEKLSSNKISSIQNNVLTSSTKYLRNGQRAVSTAAMLGLKKAESQYGQLNPGRHFVYVSYFEQNPKFGMCYMLNSNAVGMKFNDSSSLVSNSHLTKMTYIEFNPKLESHESTTFSACQAPQTLMKKMKIISHYNKQIRQRKQEEYSAMSSQMRIQKERLKFRESLEDSMKVFVKRYSREAKATLFWMSNDDTQAAFQDSSHLIIGKKDGIYISRHLEKIQFLVADFKKESEDIKKRMIYMIGVTERLKTKRLERQSVDRERGSEKQNGQCVISSVQISECPSSKQLDQKHRSLRKSEDLLKVCMSMKKLLALKRISTDVREDL